MVSLESHDLAKKIATAGKLGYEIMGFVFKMMTEGQVNVDEAFFRKGLKFYVALAYSGVNLNTIINTTDVENLRRAAEGKITMRGEKVLSKLETVHLKPVV